MDEVCGFRCEIITSVKFPLPHFSAWTLKLELERKLERERERKLERELERKLERKLERELFSKTCKKLLSKNYNAHIYNTNPSR